MAWPGAPGIPVTYGIDQVNCLPNNQVAWIRYNFQEPENRRRSSSFRDALGSAGSSRRPRGFTDPLGSFRSQEADEGLEVKLSLEAGVRRMNLNQSKGKVSWFTCVKHITPDPRGKWEALKKRRKTSQQLQKERCQPGKALGVDSLHLPVRLLRLMVQMDLSGSNYSWGWKGNSWKSCEVFNPLPRSPVLDEVLSGWRAEASNTTDPEYEVENTWLEIASHLCF